jgi:hypothetical protein
MSDLFLGQTRSEAFKLISGGAAYTLQLSWQSDLVIFNNLTDWTGTAAGIPRSFWFRGQTDAAEAYQQQVIDSAASASFNFLNPQSNGFTVADTSGGSTDYASLISGVSAADPCVVTTSAVHGLQDDQLVRITDLGDDMPTARGMGQINNKRFRITVLNTTTFSLQDPVTDANVDSTNFTAWVAGGRVQLESRSLTLNNPQVDPYSATSPYNPTSFLYDPISYRLTAGTDVMGADSEVFFVQSYGFGQVTDLGDIG